MTQSTLLRAQLPGAYLDPAFMACVHQTVSTPELVEQFDRLYGADLSRRRTPIDQMVDAASGKKDSDIASFMRFVHDAVYMRVSDEIIIELRASAARVGVTL
jgi:hypothetical protein